MVELFFLAIHVQTHSFIRFFNDSGASVDRTRVCWYNWQNC